MLGWFIPTYTYMPGRQAYDAYVADAMPCHAHSLVFERNMVDFVHGFRILFNSEYIPIQCIGIQFLFEINRTYKIPNIGCVLRTPEKQKYNVNLMCIGK